MRTLIRISFDTEKANGAIKNGVLGDLIRDVVERLQPEASYFFTDDGKRAALMVFDLKDVSDIPSIAEPFFMETGATVEFFPVMNAEELKTGLGKAAKQFGRVPA